MTTPTPESVERAERDAQLRDRIRGIRLLALDVDGVLTDGSIILDDHGVETKRFNVRDGQGLTVWIRLGFEVAIITRRSGEALLHRCRELGITRIVQASKDKIAALDSLIADTHIPAEQIAYIGDDWPDLPVLRRVGVAICPADADEHVKQAAAFVTQSLGGRGCVREAIERILSVQGLMNKALASYT